MKLKTLTITVAILAVLSLAAWFFTRLPKVARTDPRIGQPLVATDLVKSAAQLKLTDQGKTVLLKKQPDNTWQVASYYDFPADFSKLASFVRDLTAARIQRFVTANPERFSRLEFKDSAISLLDGDDKELWTITLGKTADSGGRFVHFDDEKRAYLTKLNAWLDTESRNWADAALLHFKLADIASIEIGFPDTAAVTVQRNKASDAFTTNDAPQGQQVKAATFTNLLRSLSELRFTDTTTKDDPAAIAAAQHDRTLKLTTFAGETFTVKFGRTPEQKKLKPATTPHTAQTSDTTPGEPSSDATNPPAEPEYETIPAGPVFVAIASSNPQAPINALMTKRAFKVADYSFTSLPKTSAELFEPIPPLPAKTDDNAKLPAPEK